MSPKIPYESSAVVQPLVYTVDQAAVALTLCPKTIRNLIRSGRLVHRRVGTRILIPKICLENFLKKDHPSGEKEKRARRGSATRTRRGSR